MGTAGDVNGDGYSDVIVGAHHYDNSQTDEGAAFVWYGSATGLVASGTPTNADWTAESDQASARLGLCVGTAGDVNGDGYSDVIVGADRYRYYPNRLGRDFRLAWLVLRAGSQWDSGQRRLEGRERPGQRRISAGP